MSHRILPPHSNTSAQSADATSQYPWIQPRGSLSSHDHFIRLMPPAEAGSLTPDVAGIRSNYVEPGIQTRYLWVGDRWRRR